MHFQTLMSFIFLLQNANKGYMFNSKILNNQHISNYSFPFQVGMLSILN